jgi:pimeloyl-ACP methyl ester carboxylesterase
MPLRSLHADAEYLSSILTAVEGPFVLVGHSYGGSVISHPILTKHALKSVVFVSAFLQDSGEAADELNGRWPGSKSGETTTIIRPYPGGNDLYLKADSFAEVYAGDLSPQQAKVLAAAQRPIDSKALGESFQESPYMAQCSRVGGRVDRRLLDPDRGTTLNGRTREGHSD